MENESYPTPIPNHLSATKLFYLVLITALMLITGYLAYRYYSLKQQLANFVPVEIVQPAVEAVAPSNEDIRNEQILAFRKEFVVGDQTVQWISEFWLEKSNETGWIVDISIPNVENYFNRYLAFDEELVLLESSVPYECGFGTSAAAVLNERPFYEGDRESTLEGTKFIVFQHGCAGGPSVMSLINVEEKRKIPLTDPNNYMHNKFVFKTGDVMGSYVSQAWNGILVVELQGEPLDYGYAVFDLESGKLLKTLEFNSFPQVKKSNS